MAKTKMTKKTGNKWRTESCGRCGEVHRGYSGKLDDYDREYVVCGNTNKKIIIDDSCFPPSWKLDYKGAIVVGGNFDDNGGRPSSVVKFLALALGADTVVNGGHSQDLNTIKVKGYNLVVWMPNVSNYVSKCYPVKSPGAVLICSKFMRQDLTRMDAVGRIFKMSANAVIEIVRNEVGICEFNLVDALNNEWASDVSKIEDLAKGIKELTRWTEGSIRVPSQSNVEVNDLKILAELTRSVAGKIENSMGDRFFGNASTRCSSLFPSVRKWLSGTPSTHVMVSPRNLDKKGITESDFILSHMSGNSVRYAGTRKPSVDTPVQLWIYDTFPKINVMIHGHAYIEGAVTTDEYFPCGDLRELDGILGCIKDGASVINLKNHGFLICAGDYTEMQEIIDNAVFKPKG